jgi:hypothetical protein
MISILRIACDSDRSMDCGTAAGGPCCALDSVRGSASFLLRKNIDREQLTACHAAPKSD